MKFTLLSCTAVGLVLAAGTCVANAQTVIAPQPVGTATAPLQTVTTTRTTRSVQPAHMVRRQVVTTRTVTRRVEPAAVTVATTPAPLYDEVTETPTPAQMANDWNYSQPLYDVVTPAPAAAVAPVPAAVVGAPVVGTQPFTYRYVYEPDRILVVDPATGVAIQSLPR